MCVCVYPYITFLGIHSSPYRIICAKHINIQMYTYDPVCNVFKLHKLHIVIILSIFVYVENVI